MAPSDASASLVTVPVSALTVSDLILIQVFRMMNVVRHGPKNGLLSLLASTQVDHRVRF